MIHDTITKRYEAMAPTLFDLNLSQKALADYSGRANPDRFREDNAQIVELTGIEQARNDAREDRGRK